MARIHYLRGNLYFPLGDLEGLPARARGGVGPRPGRGLALRLVRDGRTGPGQGTPGALAGARPAARRVTVRADRPTAAPSPPSARGRATRRSWRAATAERRGWLPRPSGR